MKLVLPALAVCFVASMTTTSAAKPLDPRSILKTYFETGDIPTQSEFSNFIDSTISQTPDGVSVMDWDGLSAQSSNFDYDGSSLDSMSTMDMRILSTSGQNVHGFEYERSMTVSVSFINDQGLWESEGSAVFTSLSQTPAFEVGEVLRWSLVAPVTLNLEGDPLLGQRTMTGGTYLETTLVYLPPPASAVLLTGGLVVLRRRR